MTIQNLIPINIITGFLGSGKTTLLSELLKKKKLEKTAIIINEFGEIGLDHSLIRRTDENIIELQNGCICCSIQNDLRNTLLELFKKMRTKKISIFDRIVIETTGLADPLPISDTLLNCPKLHKIYYLENLITVVDAINGENTLKTQKESLRQVSLASVIVLSKTDLVNNNKITSISDSIKDINPKTNIIKGSFGKVPITALFPAEPFIAKNILQDLKTLLEEETYENHQVHSHNLNRHGNDIFSFAMKRNIPINLKSFNFFVETLENEMGPYLLRVKGIVNILGKSQPAIINGAQKILHPVEWLDKWPDNDRSTRIIFITFNIKKNQFKGFCESILGLKEISNLNF